MNTQNTQNRKKYCKMSIQEDLLYFLISAEQPALLNNRLFPAVFCFHIYNISCKFD